MCGARGRKRCNAEAVGWDGKAGATVTEGDPARESFGFFLCFFHLVFLDTSGEIAGCAMVSPVELCLKPLDDDWLCTYIQALMLIIG